MVWELIEPTYIEAIARLENHGHVKFTENGDETIIDVDIYGFKTGKHGFHIHEKGSIELGCGSLCAHYNPYNVNHGGRDDDKEHRHVGDLGNLEVGEDGTCKMKIIDKLVKLNGKHSVLNRSIIIHEDEDDLGKGGNEESLKTGNSGKRISCGKIILTRLY